jgi:outer membrane protein assembly factor BamD
MVGMRRKVRGILILAFGLSLAPVPAFAQKKPKVVKAPPQPAASQQPSAEPDKVLYDRAMVDIKHGRYTEGRLALQTLINTYPDSEYLAKAKLAVADSYFKEGGTSNLTQAIAEYQDFTTFFPFLEEAAYAQMQVGMCHYKMMEKADRDEEQAMDAEDAFQAFILKYPQSPLITQADQRLREVQEVLAQGEFEIAHYYYTKPDYPAAAARLVELTERYPLFSESDEALFMLGDIYQKARVRVKNEDQKNHWADLAGRCYDRIVTDYPLSKRAGDAKRRLQEMGMPVPAADPAAYERMAREQKLDEAQHQGGFFEHESSVMKMPLALFNSRPDVSTAARTGVPNLNPPSDAISATDVLRPDAPGPQFNLVNQTAGAADTPNTEGGGQVDVSPGGALGATSTTVGAQIISTGGNAADPPASASGSDNGGSNMSPDIQTITPQAVTSSDAASAPTPTAATTTTNTTARAAGSAAAPPASAASATAPGASGSSSQPAAGGATNAPATSGSGDSSSTESTSKKKKGLHKLIPF